MDGQVVELNSDEVLVQTESRGGLAVASDKGITVAVDTELSPELLQEGYARDLVRHINTLRKDSGLALDDRIYISCEADQEVSAAIVNFAEYIQQETLALGLSLDSPAIGDYKKKITVDDSQVTIALIKA